MFTRRRHNLVARLTLAALLFVQAMLVAQACLLPEPTMPFAVAATEHDGSHHACHEAAPMEPNACLVNYMRDGQAANTFLHVAADAVPVVIATLPAPQDRATRPVVDRLTRALPSDPPASLRFCSLQL